MGNTTSSVSSNHYSSHCNNSTLGCYKVPDCKYRRKREKERRGREEKESNLLIKLHLTYFLFVGIFGVQGLEEKSRE